MHPLLTGHVVTPSHLERLAKTCEVPDPAPLPDFEDPRAKALLADAEILLTGWGCKTLDPEALARAPRLRLVAHAAGTVRGIVSDGLWQRGIRLVSAAAANALPVAEYTLAAILFANKRVFRLQHIYREERTFKIPWEAQAPGLGNHRKVVGLVGASRVGRRVVELLRPFDFEVLVTDPYLDESEAKALGVRKVELDTLLERSDVVSLHAPSLPQTRHQLDARRLALIRDGATLINTARGALVDHAALERELVSGRIDAIIDTTEPEVLPAESPLYELPNVLLTPHVAGALGREVERMADLALDEIERFVRGEELLYEVTEEALPRLA